MSRSGKVTPAFQDVNYVEVGLEPEVARELLKIYRNGGAQLHYLGLKADLSTADIRQIVKGQTGNVEPQTFVRLAEGVRNCITPGALVPSLSLS